MFTLSARNANQALPEIMHELQTERVVRRQSRNGPVLQFKEPFTIQYRHPLERVVFWPERDANPFFHLFESLWMLGGRNDVAFPARFSSNFAQFSDDGRTFHGAYGHRWRNHFGLDQLGRIANRLRENRDDRRCVLEMWDARVDGDGNGRDYPCNLVITFQREAELGRLDMVVFNRSNDILWGALGANCVHMSILQEYLAFAIGCPVGQYWQISANMHAYTELTPLLNRCLPLATKTLPSTQYLDQDPYQTDRVRPYPLISTSIAEWEGDLFMFLSEGNQAMGYRDPFFRRVALPLLAAYNYFSNKGDAARFDLALASVKRCGATDWRVACEEWLLRRKAAWEASRNKVYAEAV